MKPTRSKVLAMSPGEQTKAYFDAHVEQGRKGPSLPQRVQTAYVNDPFSAVKRWILTLPRR